MDVDIEPTPIASKQRPIVERPRLTRLLDRNKGRIKLLIAPAGYGKSTLAEQWLQPRPHAWYPCTAASSDVAGLALDLAALIIEALPQLERTLRMHLKVAAQAYDQVDHFTEVIIEHLEEWPLDRILAVDDYQLIAANRDAELLFEAIVERTPVPLLITARTRPSWASARQILYGDIYELEQSALAITRAEAANLLSGKAPAVTRELTTISRGWPAILSLGWHADPRILPKRTGPLPEAIQRFIAEEIFEGLGEPLFDTLILLALVNCRTSHDFEELVKNAAAAETSMGALSMLVPLQPGPDREGGKLLHPLIRTFLLSKVTTRREHLCTLPLPAKILDHLLLTSLFDNAFGFASALNAPLLMERVLSSAYPPMLASGRTSTLRTWINRADALDIDADTTILIRAELAHREGDHVASEAFAKLVASRSAVSTIRGQALSVAGAAAHLAHQDIRANSYYQAALACAGSDEARLRALFGACLATAADENPASHELLARLAPLAERTPEGALRLAICTCSNGRAFGSITNGQARCEEAAPMLTLVDDPLLTSSFLQAQSYSLALGAQYVAAYDVSQSAIRYCRKYRLGFALPHVLLTRALSEIGLGQVDAARSSVEAAISEVRTSHARLYVQANANVVLARVAIYEGDLTFALSLTGRHLSGIPERAMQAECLATHAMILMVLGETSQAEELIATARSISNCVEAVGFIAGTQLIQSTLNGAPTTSSDASQLIMYAHAAGCLDPVRYALLARPTIAGLIPVGSEAEIVIRRISSVSNGMKSVSSSDLGGYPLTRREMEICQLLVEGLSNREIANQLYISESTAKLHVRHILGKLQVRSRTHAVSLLLQENIL